LSIYVALVEIVWCMFQSRRARAVDGWKEKRRATRFTRGVSKPP